MTEDDRRVTLDGIASSLVTERPKVESSELGVERRPWEEYTWVVVMPLISTSGDISTLTFQNPTDLEERETTGLEGKRVSNT